MRHYLGIFRIQVKTGEKQDVFEIPASNFAQARKKADRIIQRDYITGARIVGCEFARLARGTR